MVRSLDFLKNCMRKLTENLLQNVTQIARFPNKTFKQIYYSPSDRKKLLMNNKSIGICSKREKNQQFALKRKSFFQWIFLFCSFFIFQFYILENESECYGFWPGWFATGSICLNRWFDCIDWKQGFGTKLCEIRAQDDFLLVVQWVF